MTRPKGRSKESQGVQDQRPTVGGTAGVITVVDPRSLRRTVAAAAVGKAVEWFD